MKKTSWIFILNSLIIGLFILQSSVISAPKGVGMKLTSKSFAHNDTMDKKYTRYGDNVAPHLEWHNLPEGTKSLVLIIDDPDAPTPTPWVHAVVYNIDPQAGELEEGSWNNVTYGQTDFNGQTGYQGPQPPKEHGKHHYIFKLFAIDTDLNLPGGKTKAEILTAIEGKILNSAELIGRYSA